jgi:hypothetical protein
MHDGEFAFDLLAKTPARQGFCHETMYCSDHLIPTYPTAPLSPSRRRHHSKVGLDEAPPEDDGADIESHFFPRDFGVTGEIAGVRERTPASAGAGAPRSMLETRP